MPDRKRQSDEAAVQFIIVDFLEEILKFSDLIIGEPQPESQTSALAKTQV